MPYEPFTYTREEIHAAVWAETMRDACRRFGVSDVALAKVCRRLNVPRPRQGHWVRLMMGQTPEKQVLPAAGPGATTKWEGKRSITHEPATPTAGNPPIPVPDVLGMLHPALKAAMPDMRRASEDIRGYDLWNGRIPILASGATLSRALRIMNALLQALESHGHRFEVRRDSAPGEPWRRGQAGVWVGDSFVGVSLFERSNGFLTLRIRGDYEPYREWTDTKTKKIEIRLHEVIPAVLARAEGLRIERIEAERRQEEARHAEIRRAEEDRLRREEEARVAKLRSALAAWREVRDVRAFVQEAHAIAAAAGRRINAESTHGRFLSWATRWANQVDPFVDLRKEIAAAIAGPPERASDAP